MRRHSRHSSYSEALGKRVEELTQRLEELEAVNKSMQEANKSMELRARAAVPSRPCEQKPPSLKY